MDVVFLDANVLFSAAYKIESRVRQVWRLEAVRLITSAYALEEARRNLPDDRRRVEFESLMTQVQVVPESGELRETVVLASKDRPILSAAIAAGATHLVTGDGCHFGALYGTTLSGVTILSPSEYLRLRKLSSA